jgi:hypothetical protein
VQKEGKNSNLNGSLSSEVPFLFQHVKGKTDDRVETVDQLCSDATPFLALHSLIDSVNNMFKMKLKHHLKLSVNHLCRKFFRNNRQES